MSSITHTGPRRGFIQGPTHLCPPSCYHGSQLMPGIYLYFGGNGTYLNVPYIITWRQEEIYHSQDTSALDHALPINSAVHVVMLPRSKSHRYYP